MKYLSRHLSAVKRRIAKTGNCILILDFDGTISPIARIPEEAFLPEKTKQNIKKCLIYLPVIIVSGRKLSDVKKKIGINGLIYAGNHGLEWQIGKRRYRAEISSKMIRSLVSTRNKLRKILFKYPKVLLEDKGLTISIHYRDLEKSEVAGFKKEFKEIIKTLKTSDLSLMEGKKVFEFRPKLNWTKGHFVQFISRYLKIERKRKFLLIYIGDDTTDEDVFKISNDIVSIRVGKDGKSKAEYYIKSQKQVDNFLLWILRNIVADIR